MKKIKIRFKLNLCGYKAGDTAEVTEDFVRRAGDDVEIISEMDDKNDTPQKDVTVSNKALTKEKVTTKRKSTKKS